MIPRSDSVLYRALIPSPIGDLRLLVGDDGVRRIDLPGGAERPATDGVEIVDHPDHRLLVRVREQLEEYFAGERRTFDLPLAPRGNPFDLAVWKAVAAIPYGALATYGEIARQVGRPIAFRAVGAANGRNPLPIVVPCHRVVGAGGRLTGYGGGLDAKAWLLRHEGITFPEGAASASTRVAALA